MNLRSFASLPVLALLAFGPACSSSGGNNNTEADTAVDEDTGTVEETTGEDSSPVDSSKPDTSVADTGSAGDTSTTSEAGGETATDAPVSTTCTSPGAIETGDCGKCGTRARLCDTTGVWLSWGACGGEKGVCVSGESRSSKCGKCGNRTETCSTTCGWEPGACSGEGICNSGDVEMQYGACSNPKYVKTRTCSATCGWGDWSACVPPKGWNDITASALTGRTAHSAVWTGTEMLIWGGSSTPSPTSGSYYADGAAYSVATDSWRTLPTWPLSGGRGGHTTVWTGSKMIVWGGLSGSYTTSTSYNSNGAAYNPATGTTGAWTAIAPPPSTFYGRERHTAVWTGTEMIVWGGYHYSYGYLANGAAYNPATDTWRTIAAAPSGFYGRSMHGAVYAGGKMIIFGGYANYSTCAPSSYLCGDAVAYDPVADSWTPLTPPSAELDGRQWFVSLTTGTTAAPTATFWGGYNSSVYLASSYYRGNGATYDPATGWKSITAPTDTVFPNAKRSQAAGWWTGSEMFIWGGYNGSYFANGASYDPATGTWKAMSDTNAPVGRAYPSSVWTGSEAIVWGGATSTTSSTSYVRNDGKIYRP